ncbi:MAG: hypothetical protein LCH32_07200 [Bacteroidetes bacterium]|nr:hypothetical protein [Bacteroidota bacterium]
MNSSNHKELINKLDEFIRKYYKNQLIKGVLYSSAVLLAAFLTVTLIEYFGEFNSYVRSALFFGYLTLLLFLLGKFIAIPILKLNKIGDVLSYEQAASIIGTHFSKVQDKLLNVLQLHNNQIIGGSNDLLFASINQKINDLKAVPFSAAIDFKENKKYLKYTLPFLFLTVAVIIIWPQIITNSTKRIINYSEHFEKEMPFKLELLNKELVVGQTQDFLLKVNATGNELPNEVFIKIDNTEFKLDKENKIKFSYLFKNIQQNIQFQLSAAGFTTKTYELKVLPKPTLKQFNLQLIYPAYIKKVNESIENTGDIQIPQGTKVIWTFNTLNTSLLQLKFSDTLITPEQKSENQFAFSRKFLSNNQYTIKALNNLTNVLSDSVSYGISVIADQYPVIEVNEKVDSLDLRNVYFSGQVKDDYGFNKLNFNYTIYSSDSTGKTTENKGNQPIEIKKENITQPFFFYLNGKNYNLKLGDRIEYYFEIFDNDGVNGSKSSKTQTMQLKAPTKDELAEKTQKNNTEIKKDIEESITKTKQLQKDLNELSKKINDKKQLGYEEKKKIEDLLKKQNELKNKIEEIKQENQANNQQQNQLNETDESLLEKQKQLEQLFENVMTPEMKKLFDELQKMMEKLDKNQVQEKLEEIKLTNKDIEKELDRNLEAFKQLELEQKMQNAIDKLDELKTKQDELNKETQKAADEKNNDQKNSDLNKKQDELNKDFNKLKEDLKEIEKKNEQLEEPNKLAKTEELQKEISKEMDNAKEQLSKNSKNSKSNASQNQKNASEKMQEMKEAMEEAMQEEEQQQEEENMATLRQILENLLNLSFSQEELLKTLPKTRIDNPLYVNIPKQQSKLKDDSKIIEDSLLALSKRAPQISALVNREISAINSNMDKTIKVLAERNTGEANMRMQSAMTSINNLALLLNESLENMQKQMKQMKNSKPGSGKCKKPGKGTNPSQGQPKPSMQSMKQLQEQLNKQMQQLKDALEKGQKPGEKPGQKPGEKPGSGQTPGNGKNGTMGMMPGTSEQFAKMAAQQEALRRQMQQMMEKLKNKGSNPGGNLADLMEQTEKDLVNKQLTNETMKRQQDILTKLLESEKAEREREQDEKRKSNEAKNEEFSNPKQFLEYKRMKEKEMEMLNTVPPNLTPYYKEKVNLYLNNNTGSIKP